MSSDRSYYNIKSDLKKRYETIWRYSVLPVTTDMSGLSWEWNSVHPYNFVCVYRLDLSEYDRNIH